jgi:hypothetical protein
MEAVAATYHLLTGGKELDRPSLKKTEHQKGFGDHFFIKRELPFCQPSAAWPRLKVSSKSDPVQKGQYAIHRGDGMSGWDV